MKSEEEFIATFTENLKTINELPSIPLFSEAGAKPQTLIMMMMTLSRQIEEIGHHQAKLKQQLDKISEQVNGIGCHYHS